LRCAGRGEDGQVTVRPQTNIFASLRETKNPALSAFNEAL